MGPNPGSHETHCFALITVIYARATTSTPGVRRAFMMASSSQGTHFMLDLLLTTTDGGTAWRHQLAPGEARAGWECVGPHGLAMRLGRVLGFPVEPASMPDRLSAYAARLERHDDGTRSYSQSRRTDPYGVAAYLLALRDRLRLAGWQGAPLSGSARLADLSALEAIPTPSLPPGLSDVLYALVAAIPQAGPLPVAMTVRLAAPREGFSPIVLRLLDALAGAGAIVRDAASDAPSAPADSDLGKLQRALLDPAAPRAPLAGDGSFLLLEADTPVEAAELAASALRDRPLPSSTLVVAGEGGALDAALFRQGLPTLGLSEASRFRPHLQALPLRLALAFRPRDPFRAAELLLLPGAPLPSHARRKLLGALSEMPGIGSPAWRKAVEEAVTDAAHRAQDDGAKEPAAKEAGQDLADRIEDWFGGEDFDPQVGITGAKAAALCAMVAEWAGARSGGADKDGKAVDAELWAHAAAVARTLQRVLASRAPNERITQLALAQLHDLAAGDGSGVTDFDGEAGRPALCSGPGAVLPGAASTLWFGFVQDVGPSPAPEPWTELEQRFLAAAGVQVAGPGETRHFEAWGWRRPLLAACERAVLVRWRLAGAKPVAPHAFLDELRTRVAPGSVEACTLGSERLLRGAPAPFAPRSDDLAPATPIVPHPVWKVPAATLRPSGSLSASQLEALLGCPFKWALSYQAQLRPGKGVDLPSDNRLLGDFAHRILQDMLRGDDALDAAKATEAEGTAWAIRMFDARVAAEAAPLVRPGSEVERDAARTLVGGAAAALLRHLKAGGWEPKEAEGEVSGKFAGKPVAGRIDLVLEKAGKPALLDLKLSGGKYRREELEKGRALQIALYSAMLRKSGKALPPAGFLTLDDGQLLTVNPQAFPGATAVEGPSAQETLQGAEVMFKAWEKVFAEGLLPICSEDLTWEEPVVEATGPLPDDPLARREAPCKFCSFTMLCDVTVGEEVSP